MEIYNEKGIRINKVVVGALQVNCYIITDTVKKVSAVIDPGDEAEKIIKEILRQDTTVKYVIATHGHFDHILAVNEIKKKYDAELAAGKKETMLKDPAQNLSTDFGRNCSVSPDLLLSEGDVLNIGDIRLRVAETPGHTPGGIVLIHDRFIFSGDTLFAGSVGRTDFPGGDMEALITGIKNKIMILDDDIKIFPGHGPASTIRNEKEYNEFLNG